MKRTARVFALSATILFTCSATMPALAHPGNVDKEGCHVQHSTGQRHCHPERRKTGGEAPKKAARPAPGSTDKNPAGEAKPPQQ